MRRLIFDHFRRWWWLLAIGAALEFLLGAFISGHRDIPFESWVLLIAMWMGANLILFDLKRGIVRVLAALPLTGRQIGVSWWLATVAIPAIALAVLLFLGAATYCHFHANSVFPVDRLAMASLFSLFWLVITFILCFPAIDFTGSFRERLSSSLFNFLGVIVFFGGMLFCQDASKKPERYSMLFGFGAVFIAVGWFRSTRFTPAAVRLPIATPRRAAAHADHRTPSGRGGLPFLIRSAFRRAFLMGLGTLAIMPMVMALQGNFDSHLVKMQAKVFPYMLCALCLFQITPFLRQLRFLRTTPVSPTRLAAAMFAMAILPFIALAPLAAGMTWVAAGKNVAIAVLNVYIFILASASLCVFFLVWRGAGKQGYALAIITLFGFQWGGLLFQTMHRQREIGFSLAVAIAAICFLLAFRLTCIALRRSSHVYRLQANIGT